MSRVATIPCLSPASTSGSTPRARSRVHRLSVRARSWQGQNEKSRSATGPHKVKVPLPVDGPLAPPQDVVDAVAAWPWRGGLEPCGDHELASVEVEGTIPKDLKGSFYRVGPGRIRVGKQRYAHWFDGDGMIFGVELDGSTNTARAACKMVRTARLAKQERAGVENGVAVRGAWTQAKSPLANIFNFPTNPANTSPMFHAGKLLVLCEGGAPIEVDPLSLDTKGECVFGSNLPMGFSAHAKKDPKDGKLYTWGLCKPPAIGFQVARLSANGTVEKVISLPLDTPEFTLIHDCAMSEKYLAFIVPPWKLRLDRMGGALAGSESFGHSFDWRDDLGAYMVIIAKASMEIVFQGTIPSMSTYHFAGAYEETAAVPAPARAADEVGDEFDDPFEFCGYTGFGDAECPDDNGFKPSGGDESEGETRELLHVLVNRLNGDRRALEKNFGNMYDSVWDPKGYNTLCDYVVDVATGKLLSSDALVPQTDAAWGGKGDVDDGQLPMEFPVVAPGARNRKPRFVYTLGFTGGGGGYFDCVQKLDVGACRWKDGVRVCRRSGAHAVRVLPPGVFPSEVEFVPKSKGGAVTWENEDDGYLLYLEYDSSAHRSALVVLDAKDIDGKEIARVKMPYHVPHSFHGTFERAGEGAR